MRLKEFAPVGSGNGNFPPRGPKTPGRDPWGGDEGPGEGPYDRPKPKYYTRSSSYFEQFEADWFDKEDFDKKTGVFKGYWDYDGKLKQIAYFKFDDPTQTGSDDPGMGWYYEPVDEGSLKEFAPAGGEGGDNYGGDLYDILMGFISERYPDLFDYFGSDVVDSTVSNMVVMGSFGDIDPSSEDDLEDAVSQILVQLEDDALGESKGELWYVLEPRNIGGHAARYYVAKGHGKDLKIWKNKTGAGDFIKQADAEAKAAELNKGVAEQTFQGDMMRQIYDKYRKPASHAEIRQVFKFLLNQYNEMSGEPEDWENDLYAVKDSIAKLKQLGNKASYFDLADALYSYDTEFREMMIDFSEEELDPELVDTLLNDVFFGAKQKIGVADMGNYKIDLGKPGVAEAMPMTSLTSRYVDDPKNPAFAAKQPTGKDPLDSLSGIVALRKTDPKRAFRALQDYGFRNPNDPVIVAASKIGNQVKQDLLQKKGITNPMPWDTTDEMSAMIQKSIFDYIEKNLSKTGVAEGHDEDEGNPVMNAITSRIMRTRPDLLDHDLRKLQAAIRDVALDVGDVDEIGSSDISGWVKRVEQRLSGTGVAEAFGPLPKDNQQIRLGKYSVDIERVGLNKNYIGFTWHDSQGQEHYEEVPVGDLGSYDDLIDRIKGEIKYQERRLKQGVAEGHADQQRKIFKQNGKPVGEVGIDRESSPGVGQWYMKCYAYDIDNSGYDSYEEAVAELKHCLKQGVAEAMPMTSNTYKKSNSALREAVNTNRPRIKKVSRKRVDDSTEIRYHVLDSNGVTHKVFDDLKYAKEWLNTHRIDLIKD